MLCAVPCYVLFHAAATLLWALPQTRLMTRLCRLWLRPSRTLLLPGRPAPMPRRSLSSAAASRSGRLLVRSCSSREPALQRVAPAGQRQLSALPPYDLSGCEDSTSPAAAPFSLSSAAAATTPSCHPCMPCWHAPHGAHQGCQPPPPPAAAGRAYKRPSSNECRCNKAQRQPAGPNGQPGANQGLRYASWC